MTSASKSPDPQKPAQGAARRVRLFRNGRSQAIRIPKEFEFDGEAVDVRREGDRLIIEAPRSNVKELLALLATLEPIDEEFTVPDDPPGLDGDLPDFGVDDGVPST